MPLTPLVAIHMSAALGALLIGPFALWSRRIARPRPRLHRAFGHAWVTLMLVTAVSALFIRDFRLPNILGYTPIHLLVPVTLASLFASFWKLARGNVAGHRTIMVNLYIGACVVAGAFTLLPSRLLGTLLWSGGLGWGPAGPATAPLHPLVLAVPTWFWLTAAAAIAVSAWIGLRRTRRTPPGPHPTC